MLPHPNHRPPLLVEKTVRLSIPPTIGRHLLSPIVGIRLAHRVMLRAPVPEATVHEDRNLEPRKYDVGPPTNSFDRRAVDEVAQAAPMQLPAQSHLRAVSRPRLDCIDLRTPGDDAHDSTTPSIVPPPMRSIRPKHPLRVHVSYILRPTVLRL